jgi:hypothetical protein
MAGLADELTSGTVGECPVSGAELTLECPPEGAVESP